MIGVDVSASSIDDLGERVARGVRTGMRDAADAGFAVSQEEAPVDRGTLLQSGQPPAWRGDVLRWGYTADHARVVEEGSVPHYPPIDPLKGWARRVLGDEGAAYAVQEAIVKEGTPAQPYVEPGVQAQVRELQQRGLSPYVDDEL